MFARVLVTLLAGAALAAPTLADIGRVKRAAGDAKIVRGARSLAPTPGALLESGDVLRTGADGRISVTFVDNTRFSAGPNSEVSVDKFAFDRATHKGEFLARVNRGSLAVVSGQIAKSGRDAMKVKTPTALLGVRGTRFIVTASK